jgi:FAD-NAD(P)-binding
VTARAIAVVGSGPRGMMVIERLAARLGEAAEAAGSDGSAVEPVELYFIDETEVGAGRIYRTDQPHWYLMNTVAGQCSAFSGVPDAGPHRAGAGPSFTEWWSVAHPENFVGDDGYAPRCMYGKYLRYVLDRAEANLPAHVRLTRIERRVERLDRLDGGYLLELVDGERIRVDRVVLTTGHAARVRVVADQAAPALFAERFPNLRYIGGDSPADMPLDEIGAGAAVGIVGLGLSFYDVMAALTLGRGGTFEESADGTLRYRASGREPVLYAGSRSGMPLPARGRNQKPPTYSYRPVLFRPDNVRRAAPGPSLDFMADVLPWLLAEVDLVFHGTRIRQAHGDEAQARFVLDVVEAAQLQNPRPKAPPVAAIAAAHGDDLPPRPDLDELARPFAGLSFIDPGQFKIALAEAISADLAVAASGNVDAPLKAALDVLRDTRWVIRELVDFSGLDPVSHQRDFLGWYVPRSSFLAAGPPIDRLRQVLALTAAGVLNIVGPETEYGCDEEAGRYVISSPRVAGSAVHADVLIDARIPDPDLGRDLSPLTSGLREAGVWTQYVNGSGPRAFHTGGVAVTGSPFHPIGRDGEPEAGLYVLGIPTEHTRWFMQVGSSRPGMWSDFVRDADDVAADALESEIDDERAGAIPALAGAGE